MALAVVTFDLTREELIALDDGREVVIPVRQLPASSYWSRLSLDCRQKLTRYFQNHPSPGYSIQKFIPAESQK